MPVGSHGDVLPFLGLSRALQQRGHEVLLLASPVFAPAATHAGVALHPLGTPDDYRRVEEDPDLSHPRRGLQAVGRVIAQYLEPAYRELESLTRSWRPTVLIGGTLAFAMRCLGEKHGLPTATVHLQPGVIRSSLQPPVLGSPYPVMHWLPPPLMRGLWWLLDRLLIDPTFARPLNGLRRSLGLSPIDHILGDWLQSADLVLGLFPSWFCAPAPDWPPHLIQTAFPLYDQESGADSPADLEEFLGRGEAPVLFTGGTGFATMRPFYERCLRACRQLGCRGLLLTRHAANVPEGLDSQVRHYRYLPFSQVLPRCAAIVHHGGMGTTAQALACGLPQVVLPQAHDQFDNAYRLQRLGVSRTGRLESSLYQVLSHSDYRRRARRLAERVESGLDEAVSAIESWSQRSANCPRH